MHTVYEIRDGNEIDAVPAPRSVYVTYKFHGTKIAVFRVS